jgi:hypothetical protein
MSGGVGETWVMGVGEVCVTGHWSHVVSPHAPVCCPGEPPPLSPPPHLQDGQLRDQLLGRLALEAAVVQVPGRTLQVQPRHVAPMAGARQIWQVVEAKQKKDTCMCQ